MKDEMKKQFPSVAALIGAEDTDHMKLVKGSVSAEGRVCANCIAYGQPERCGHGKKDRKSTFADYERLMEAVDYYKSNPKEFWHQFQSHYKDDSFCSDEELARLKAVFPRD